MTQQKWWPSHHPTVDFTSVTEPWQQMAGACWHLPITILLPFLINSRILRFTCVHKCHQMSRKCQGLGHEDRRGVLSLCVCIRSVHACKATTQPNEWDFSIAFHLLQQVKVLLSSSDRQHEKLWQYSIDYKENCHTKKQQKDHIYPNWSYTNVIHVLSPLRATERDLLGNQ